MSTGTGTLLWAPCAWLDGQWLGAMLAAASWSRNKQLSFDYEDFEAMVGEIVEEKLRNSP